MNSSLIDLLLTSQLRGLVLLLIAWALANLLRRRSPSYECIVWRGAFAGLLAIPLLTSLAPPLTLPQKATTGFLATLESARQHYTVTYLDGRTPSTRITPALRTAEQRPNRSEATTNRSASDDQQRRSRTTAAPKPQDTLTKYNIHWPTITLAAWITGAALMFLRLFTAFLLRRNMLRRSTPFENTTATNTLTQLRRSLSIRPSVTLRLHPDLPSPLSWGISRPTILLPADASRWDEPTLRLVLSHELSHFTHRDAIYRLLSELALAAYWINPLAWLALRRARLSEEQATDAAVLRRGEDPAHYADLLLTFARRTGTRTPILSSPMAQPSTIAARLDALLEPGNRFAPPSRRTRLLLTLTITGIAIATGGLAFQAHSASGNSKSKSSPLLYTKVFVVPPETFSNDSTPVSDRLWKEHGLTPGPGSTAIYNASTSQLIIRATEADFEAFDKGIFKDLHQNKAIQSTYSGIGVLLFELPTPEANQLEDNFANASDASGALKNIRDLAAASPPTVRLLGSLHMPPNLKHPRRSRIGISSGANEWNNRVELETRIKTTDRPHQLQVSLAASIGASSQGLSITTILKPGVPRLAGFLDAKDGTTRTAVFLTLGTN